MIRFLTHSRLPITDPGRALVTIGDFSSKWIAGPCSVAGIYPIDIASSNVDGP
jgi:hypothetical protein